jgi:hypothetical protein
MAAQAGHGVTGQDKAQRHSSLQLLHNAAAAWRSTSHDSTAQHTTPQHSTAPLIKSNSVQKRA